MWSGGMKGHPRPRPWFSAGKGWRTQSGSRTSHYPRLCSSSILGSFSRIWGEWSMRLTNGLGQHQWCGNCTFLSKHSFQTPWCCTSSTLKSHLLLLSSFTASEGVSQCPQYCAVFSVNLIILWFQPHWDSYFFFLFFHGIKKLSLKQQEKLVGITAPLLVKSIKRLKVRHFQTS